MFMAHRGITKKLFAAFMIFGVLHLTGCGLGASGMLSSRLNELNNSRAEKMVHDQLDEIQRAIDTHDKEAIKALFAPVVKDNMDLDDGIAQLIQLFHNRIDAVEQLGGSESDSNNYGDIIATYAYNFSVSTKKTNYELVICGCNEDYRSSDNVGMTQILVWPARESRPEGVGDTGIYIYEQ